MSAPRISRALFAAFLLAMLALPACKHADDVYKSAYSFDAASDSMVRTELFFGMSIPDGGTVSDADWQKFVDESITPRFPYGLTAVKAYGQWLNSKGGIDREPSRVVILLHGPDADADAGIEAIRKEYKERFKQESVMRVTGASRVSF